MTFATHQELKDQKLVSNNDIFCYIFEMNAKHRKTLESIFRKPVTKQLEWKAIENLLIAIGAKVIEGRGSRVRFHKDGEIATFHRPHPNKEAKPYQVNDVREFLLRLGVTP